MPTDAYKSPHSLLPQILAACLAAALSALFALSCVDRYDSGVDPGRAFFVGRPPAYINEVHSANTDYTDEFGGDPGWVEFYNPSDSAVNLSGYWLSSDPSSGRRWELGDVEVEPRGYASVFMSGRSLPDSYPPQDSVDLIGWAARRGARGSWGWADNQNTPPGKSTVEHTFDRANGRISGKLVAVDNPSLGWSSAVVMLSFADVDDNHNVAAGGGALDLSGANQILLRGYISKDTRLEVRLPSDGVKDWEAWTVVLAGTGVADDLYIVELPANSEDYPDLKSIYGLRFANRSNFRGTIEFSFTSILARKRRREAHASFELAKSGGKLFLMDSVWNIRDSVAYPAGALGLSYAKKFDNVASANKSAWAMSKPPTPNAANSNEYYDAQVSPPSPAGIPRSGYYADSLVFTLPTAVGAGVSLRCDTSGAFPTAVGESALLAGATITLTTTTVMRCAQFKEGSYPSTEVMRTYIVGERLPTLPVVSIAVDPQAMFGVQTGLYWRGPNSSPQPPHYGANYWADTELPISIDFFEGGARHAWNYAAGLTIFGNFSRINDKKSVAINFREKYGQKSLSYTLLPEHPHLRKFKRFILRNNGNNFGQDYIRDMLASSLTEGLGIDYQKGRAVIVYYNGSYYGIHNLRERANAHYFETNYDIDREWIDLVKANNEVNSGSDADYQRILKWVEGKSALDNDDVKQLGEWLDLDNFTNIFQAEIYIMNTDWPGNNMKRWRASAPVTKWKWFMYDNDFGFGKATYNDQSSVNMLEFLTGPSAEWPNPGYSTLLFRRLIENEGYKRAFINRFSLLLTTYFSPERVGARIDALMAPLESEIPIDQSRWGLKANPMTTQLATIINFGRSRAGAMQGELEAFFEIDGAGAVDLTVSCSGSGSVLVHNLPIPGGAATFKAYPDVPLVLKAVPSGGTRFEGWNDGVMEAERVVTVTGGQAEEYRAIFGSGEVTF